MLYFKNCFYRNLTKSFYWSLLKTSPELVFKRWSFLINKGCNKNKSMSRISTIRVYFPQGLFSINSGASESIELFSDTNFLLYWVVIVSNERTCSALYYNWVTFDCKSIHKYFATKYSHNKSWMPNVSTRVFVSIGYY